MSIDKYISPYVASQFPRMYREEGAAFIEFVKKYYEWMEQEGGVLNMSANLQEYRDIDTTLDEFIVHFKNKYMAGLPEGILGNKRTLQKHIKEIYSSKGTAQGLELLFRLLYNEECEVYHPGDDILRASDGVWVQPVYLEVSVNPYNVFLIGEQVTGRESLATAIVEDFQTRYINKRQINVMFLSNVRGSFKTSELLLSNVISDPLKSPTVIGSMTDIEINESGFGFAVGDVLEVGGGNGLLGKAVVSSVSPRNGAVSFTIMKGGSGFANDNVWAPNTINVEAINVDNPGIGADFEIGDIENTEIITTPVDTIAPYANTALNSADYEFPTNVGVENINTPLDQALNIQNITVGTVKSLRAINPGAGYNGPVLVTIDSPVISGLMITDDVNGNYKGNNAIVDGKAAAGNGAINTVKILNSGIGYANGDTITLTNANVPFVAGGVVVLQKEGRGEGYWKDTSSFLNSDKFIQDSFYYQEYSYETRLSVAFSYYSDLLKKLWHPAGTQAFGKVVIASEIDSSSEAVEVDIIATRFTEYATEFSTFLLTNVATGTSFVTQYATQYITARGTETTRSTSEDFLVNQPNLIVNGEFTFNVDNWVPRGSALFTWDNGVGRLERANNSGSIVQMVPTTVGQTYQFDMSYANATAAVTVYASAANSTANTDVIFSTSKSGSANTFQFTFDAAGTNTYIIVLVTGANGTVAEIDDVQLRSVPTITQQTSFATAFVRDTAVNAGVSRSTTFNTSTVFNTAFNTQYATVYNSFPTRNTTYATQLLTASAAVANRATNRATATAFNTAYDTVIATNRATATSRSTVYATNFATSTAFDTAFNTTFATNRATTTGFNTTYDTAFATNRATTTGFNTTYGTTSLTNVATATSIVTSKVTNSIFITDRLTATNLATNRATTTSFATSFATSRGTSINTTTSYNTTFNTTFTTSYITTFGLTAHYRITGLGENLTNTYIGDSATSALTSRSTSGSTVRGTSKSTATTTTTTYDTSLGTSRSTTTAFVTNFNTTTSFNTNFDTSTAFVTSFNTTTAYNTTGQTTVATSKSTTTGFDTAFATARGTSVVTDTTFDTSADTVFGTNQSTTTAFDTTKVTSFNTTTAFNTLFATNRTTSLLTNTAYSTSFLTNTFKVTSADTTGLTATTVPTVASVLTTRATNFATNRATATSRTTLIATTIATGVTRETARTTVFVAFPTSFVTGYLTGTQIATDYQTNLATNRSTNSTYDTEYPTERLTSVLTQTDVAD